MTDSVHSDYRNAEARDEGGPAFPVEHLREEGMSLRDYFAAKAMHAIMTTPKPFMGEISADDVATMAGQMADAMLKARRP